MQREIVKINEELCDGCGECVPACAEGAIRIIDGKARMVSDRLCDGLGACLGQCPRGAITMERREADPFSEDAVREQQRAPQAGAFLPKGRPAGQTCPGSRFAHFEQTEPSQTPADGAAASSGRPSELTHWPVQLRLLPPTAPIFDGAHLLVAADCVPVAYSDFQSQLLRGRTVAIGCPKLDDLSDYVEKLRQVLVQNRPRSITVARMEVPCCLGIVQAVVEARRLADSDVSVREVVISTRGELLMERDIPPALVAGPPK